MLPYVTKQVINNPKFIFIVRGCAGRPVCMFAEKMFIPTTCVTHGGSGSGTSRSVPQGGAPNMCITFVTGLKL